MITVRKLASLPRKTRLRKIMLVLQELERDCRAGLEVDARYVQEMAGLLTADDRLGERLRVAADRAAAMEAGDPERCRRIDALRNALLTELGKEPAEWDLLLPENDVLDRTAREVRGFYVYLEDLRSPYNVGAVFRSAESFGVRRIYLSPDTPRPDHRRAARSSMGATESVPWRVCTLEEAHAEAAVPLFALETGGVELARAPLPEPGMVVVGSEELGVSAEALSRADASGGRVSIEMAGAKASLNVAVAFGILAHHWWRTKKPAGETLRPAP